jgi:hypothetical protein
VVVSEAEGPDARAPRVQGELRVLGNGAKSEVARFRLRELHDVALDTKTIQRVTDGPSAILMMRYIDARPQPEVDVARIVLVGKKESFTLSDEYLAHLDASEWLGKIRVFLRKNGWVPEDERAAKASAR